MRQLKNFSSKSEKTFSDDEMVNDYIKKYDGFSEDQLIDELIKSVQKSKKDGSYNEEQMDMFVQMASPQLNDRQRIKLTNMIELIKSGEL